MRWMAILVFLACIVAPGLAQDKDNRTKARPTKKRKRPIKKEGLEYLNHRQTEMALGSFKKADKQDIGHCLARQKKMIEYGLELREWKTAQAAAEEMIAQAHAPRDAAILDFSIEELRAVLHFNLKSQICNLKTRASVIDSPQCPTAK